MQYIEYVPFGEVFLEERNNKWNTPYLFNAKELDEETGLYYYGARYYDPRVSLFYGVDPLVEKTGTAYQYCYQNPVKFVDPTGMEGEDKDPIAPGWYGAMAKARTIGFSLRHPIAALAIGLPSPGSTNISTNAVRFSTRIGLQENDAHEGSQTNAFRHVLWQAQITVAFGESIAKQIANAHEDNPYMQHMIKIELPFFGL